MEYPPLVIPQTLAAGPGPGNTDPRVLERLYQTGVADHMQKDVVRGMVEAKMMLRKVFGTKNVHPFGVAGTGFRGLDCMLSMILPGDRVVVFVNGTFSGIDGLTIRMKAANSEELAADSLNPQTANVTIVDVPHGQSVTGDIVEKALAEHKPMWAFMAHWETGSGRINDIQGFNNACGKHGALGIVDAVSSLGIEDFDIASIKEIEDIRKISPKAKCSYMHTVKSRENINEAYFKFGVKTFSLDTKDELIKIIESTNYAKDLELFVRVSVSNEHAEIDL